MATVVNKYQEPYDVYIGRGSKWGNPFVIGKDGNRDDVIKKYSHYLKRQIAQGEVTKQDLLSLRNKRLGCFCKPKPCHGDIIKKAVEWADKLKGD